MKSLTAVEIIQSKGQSLEKIGVTGFALNQFDSLKLLEVLLEDNAGVLGGDVYLFENDSPKSTYDNWHCDRLDLETDRDFALRSINCAKDYILNYSKPEAFFSVVLA